MPKYNGSFYVREEGSGGRDIEDSWVRMVVRMVISSVLLPCAALRISQLQKEPENLPSS